MPPFLQYFTLCLILQMLRISHSFRSMPKTRILPAQSVLAMSLTEEVQKQTLKEKLYLLSAKTSKGTNASPKEAVEAEAYVSSLEKLNPTYNPAQSQLSVGTWELIYTNTKVLRASPLFMTVRAAFGERSGLFNRLVDIYSAALKIAKIGRVSQVITPTSLQTEFETELPVPVMKFVNTISSIAEIERTEENTWHLFMDRIRVKEGFSSVPLIDRFSGLPIKSVARLLENLPNFEAPRAVVTISFVDKDLRIARDQDSNVFVFTRIDEYSD